MTIETVQVVWFKRDLRVWDHAPLCAAADQGPLLPLYIVEPALWRQPDYSQRHWAFIRECLSELDQALGALGQPLIVRVGEAIPVLEELARDHPLGAIWSHEESGNGWTFARDRAVAAWAKARAIPWHELPSNGVVRRLGSRNRWSREWERRMGLPCLPAPQGLEPLPSPIATDRLPDARELGLTEDRCEQRQRGGRAAAEQTLGSFFSRRGERYHREISSPNSAFDACSRLSTHFAWGTLSIREVVQLTRRQRERTAAGSDWSRALEAFEGRLHWHCHFIQKLESEPRIEFEEMHRGYAGLRGLDPDRLEAWSAGMTGFPLVDACMRALKATGWINFRMRAMLVAFSSYHLWQHWREPALHLARQFTDYEPGIHYAQVQMQSGTTGINAVRIYNPVKQSQDQDPEGRFIRRWVPELSAVPNHHIHQPWRMTAAEQRHYGCVLGQDYPQPLVNHLKRASEARREIGRIRGEESNRQQSREVHARHGSRRRAPRRPQPSLQRPLPFD